MPKKIYVLAGSKKGLFLGMAGANRKAFKFSKPVLAGENINAVAADTRKKLTFYAGSNNAFFGPTIFLSTDGGAKWKECAQPPRFPKESGLSAEAVWTIVPAGPNRPGVLYAGMMPASLFKSTDNGQTWNEVTSLTQHPTRKDWQPGGGGLCLHTIVLNPHDPKHILVAISAVGVFETFDEGATWKLSNETLPSVFHPDQGGGPTSCVHRIAAAAGSASDPLRLYQQNHVGTYVRQTPQSGWERREKGLPSTFGFPLVAHPHDRDCAYVIPLESDRNRAPKDGRLAVYRTTDGAASWKKLDAGLPRDTYVSIMRDAFASDGLETTGLYFGTSSGQLYASNNEGKSWQTLADLLPPVYSVRAVVAG